MKKPSSTNKGGQNPVATNGIKKMDNYYFQLIVVSLRRNSKNDKLMATVLRKKKALRLHPQYIKDTVGNSLVVLPRNEYISMLEEIEAWEDSMLYLQAKSDDSGERIPMETAFAEIEKNRKNG